MPTLADAKDALAKRVTFQDMQTKYDLEITETTPEGIGAENPAAPAVGYWFEEREDAPGVFRLVGMSGPASLLLPEYVGRQLDEIPLVLWKERDETWAVLEDGSYFYNVHLHDNPGRLTGDSEVSMGFEP